MASWSVTREGWASASRGHLVRRVIRVTRVIRVIRVIRMMGFRVFGVIRVGVTAGQHVLKRKKKG